LATLQAQIDAAFAPDHAAAVGCGRGCGATVLGHARGVGSGGRVVGVDVSQPMFAVAESRARAAEFTNVAVVVGRAESA
jgi:ubiquinone/menaquinone biosynthesis C-methylase UbiE